MTIPSSLKVSPIPLDSSNYGSGSSPGDPGSPILIPHRIIVHTKEGPKAIMGKRFVDASGDSDLVYFAGGEVEVGREEDHMSMGCSLEFVLGGVDMDKYMDPAAGQCRKERQTPRH